MGIGYGKWDMGMGIGYGIWDAICSHDIGDVHKQADFRRKGDWCYGFCDHMSHGRFLEVGFSKLVTQVVGASSSS